jgi:hypothetical protein
MTDYDKVRQSPYYFKTPKRERTGPKKPRTPRAPRGPRVSDAVFEEFKAALEPHGLSLTRLPSHKQGGAVVRFSTNDKTCVGHRIKKAFFPRPSGAGYYRGEIAKNQAQDEIHLFLVGEDAETQLYVLPCVSGKCHFPHQPNVASKFEQYRSNLDLLM